MVREYRVFGPPGTGKTTWLARQCEKAALRYDADRIYALSFTRAAAVELGGRQTGVPRSNIGTIHSLCYRALHQPPIIETQAEFLVEWNQRYGHLWPVTGDLYLDEPPVGKNPNKALMDWNRERGLLTGQVWPPEFVEAWEAFKTECGVCDFTDLLLNAPEAIPADVVLVDEVQDLTPLQWRIVRQWGESAEVFVVVGDDDQTIYEWLGARPDEFLRPLPEENILTLSQSYRLPRAVYKYAQQWISQLEDRRHPKEFAPRDAEGSVSGVPYSYQGAASMVEELVQRADDNRDIMVLASCRYMLHPLLKALRSAGVLFHNPYRANRRDWNPIQPGGTAGRIQSFFRLRDALREMNDEVLKQTPLWKDLSLLIRVAGNMVRGTRARIEEAPEILADPLVTVSGWFTPSALVAIEDGNLTWLEDQMTQRASNVAEYLLAVLEKYGEKALEKRPRICVGTIHSVKGGQADDVFLFPDLPYAAVQALNQNPLRARDAITRQFYVGMTRARENFFACAGSSKMQVGL